MKYTEYKTTDIQIATLLLAEGITFIRIDCDNPRRKGFVFQDEPAIANIVVGFWQDTHKIAPRKYMGAYKELKNRLFE